MVLGIGHVEDAPVGAERHTLGMIEAGRRRVTIGKTALQTADHLLHLVGVEIGHDDAIVVRIGDEKPPPWGIGQDLAGKGKACLRLRFSLQLEPQRRAIDLVLGVKLGHQAGDDLVERLVYPLARALAHDAARRVDDDQRRPGAHGVGVPHDGIPIVGDRVFQLVAQHDLADVVRVPLVLELGRVDADDDQLAGVLGLQPLELGDDVLAVDAPIGPEIQHDHLAAQFRYAQGTICVEPVERRELGRSNRPGVRLSRG